jgi:carbonic anhydrase/acetyltransferase-like protein (isoleucine patch superfamily)
MRYALHDWGPNNDEIWRPELDPECWVASNVVLVGKVIVRKNASIWFNSVVRADNEPIVIGEESNVQEGSVLHADPTFPLNIGARVTIGHMVMLHGCSIADETLIGIGSIILNGAKIGKHCLIGAHTLIPEGKEIPDNSVVMGSPGKIVREVSEKDFVRLTRPAASYARKWRRFATNMKPES